MIFGDTMSQTHEEVYICEPIVPLSREPSAERPKQYIGKVLSLMQDCCCNKGESQCSTLLCGSEVFCLSLSLDVHFESFFPLLKKKEKEGEGEKEENDLTIMQEII